MSHPLRHDPDAPVDLRITVPPRVDLWLCPVEDNPPIPTNVDDPLPEAYGKAGVINGTRLFDEDQPGFRPRSEHDVVQFGSDQPFRQLTSDDWELTLVWRAAESYRLGRGLGYVAVLQADGIDQQRLRVVMPHLQFVDGDGFGVTVSRLYPAGPGGAVAYWYVNFNYSPTAAGTSR